MLYREGRMTAVTALLHRAAVAGLTIAWDNKRGSAVIFPIRSADPKLIKMLHARGDEIVELLGNSGFWACCCPQCRGTVH